METALPEGVSTTIGGIVMSVESKEVMIIRALISWIVPPTLIVSSAPNSRMRKRSVPVESSTRWKRVAARLSVRMVISMAARSPIRISERSR